MTRAEYIAICRQCKNRGFDPDQGIICNLSGTIADFANSCDSFILEETVKEPGEITTARTEGFPLEKVDEEIKAKLLLEQNLDFAIIGGLLAMIVSSFMWAAFSVVVGLQFILMAVVVGLVTGFAIKLYGSGIEKKFQILGAFLSLMGCLIGNLLTQVGFVAQDANVSFKEVISVLTPGLIVDIMIETFDLRDLLFYLMSILAGYSYSVIKVTPQLIEKIKNGKQTRIDVIKQKIRLPLAMVSIVLILFLVYEGLVG